MNPCKKFLTVTSLLALGVSATPAQLIVSEIHPTGSSASSTYAADWFELYNAGAAALDLTGWKVDDNSAAFASALALRGITSLAPGQAAVFMESDALGVNDAGKGAAFISAWFGSSAPASFALGFYGGSGIGLGSGGDAVNIYDGIGTLLASVSFGAATTGVTFDNAAGLSGTISQLSAVGVNGAFGSVAGSEIGSPGVVPEPTVLSLGLAGVATMIFRKRLVARR